jgi:hypothetical protein
MTPLPLGINIIVLNTHNNISIGYSVKIVVNVLKYRSFRKDDLWKWMLKGIKEQILEAEMIPGKKPMWSILLGGEK